jgi:hypothetical protein
MLQPPPVHPDADGRDRRDLRSVPLLLAIPLEGDQVLAYASQSSLSAFRVGDGCVTHTKLNERDPVRMSGTTADHEIGLVCGELVRSRSPARAGWGVSVPQSVLFLKIGQETKTWEIRGAFAVISTEAAILRGQSVWVESRLKAEG